MAGDVAAVAGTALAMFLIGALLMLLALVAIGIREEDRATQGRPDRRLQLRKRAASYRSSAVRRVVGLGQRVPDRDCSTDGDQRGGG
jgi:hypothetical protein